MTFLVQHARKQYINKDCPKGFCEDKESATEFSSVFSAMKYLDSINVESLEEYKFIENNENRKVRNDGRTKINLNGRRRRPI